MCSPAKVARSPPCLALCTCTLHQVFLIAALTTTRRMQVAEIAGALGWRLSDAEVAELDAVSAKIPRSTGAVSLSLKGAAHVE